MRVNSPSSESAKAVASSLSESGIHFKSSFTVPIVVSMRCTSFMASTMGLAASIAMRWCKLRASWACRLYGTRGSG